MNKYEQKLADRKERMIERSNKIRSEAEATYSNARKMAEAIPFGQPILVGHHSEGRDRNYRARITSTMGKAFNLMDKADHYARKAESVGTGGISSDDPDALEKLRAELESVQAAQERMKLANKLIRAHKGEARVTALAAHSFTQEQIDEILKPDFMNRIGFPAYALQNNNANAHRIAKRIQELEARRERPDVVREGAGYTYREDTEENRVMFEFPGKPTEEVRGLLKKHAFKWSPSRGAWVRQLTNAGIYAGKCVREKLDAGM